MSEKKGFFGRLFNRGKEDETEEHETLSEAVGESLEPSEQPPAGTSEDDTDQKNTGPQREASSETSRENTKQELRSVLDAIYAKPAQGLTPEKRAISENLTAELQAELLTQLEAIHRETPEPIEEATEAEKKPGGFFSNLFGKKDEGPGDAQSGDLPPTAPDHPESEDRDTEPGTEEILPSEPERPSYTLSPEQRQIAETLTEDLKTELETNLAAAGISEEDTDPEKKSGGFLSNLFGKQEKDGDTEQQAAESSETELTFEDAEPVAAEDLELEIEAAEPEPDLPSAGQPAEVAPEPKRGFFSRLTQGLSKSSAKLSGGVSSIFTKRKLDDETLEELEDLLITADLGIAAATRITTALAKDKFDKEISDDEVRQVLAEQVAVSLTPLEKEISIDPANKPHVILMTGVNGAGKTTTIGKLAKKFSDEGKSVMLAAGDTFRAAAIEQLTVWGERVGAPVVSRDVGADAAGLAYDALQEARAQNIDVLMIDTAGRLQNRTELMDELAKIVRVIRKLDDTAPHDTILVLDATVGQNAINQAEAFTQIAGVSGLIMTKLDGTARGGVLVALADKFALPVHYVGVGESVEDLQPFSADNFTRALTGIDSLTEAA